MGKCEKFSKIKVTMRKNFFVKLKKIHFGKPITPSKSTFSDVYRMIPKSKVY